MTFTEKRALARAAVNAARFRSILPPGECDNDTVVAFLKCRREEIVATARSALGNHARAYDAEEILGLLYGKIPHEESVVLPAA